MAINRIGVLTGGGDAPGLNPAIRAMVYRAAEAGVEVLGLADGWDGLIAPDAVSQARVLLPHEVRRWLREGGTRLGSSRTNPFRYGKAKEDRSKDVLANAASLRLDAVVAMGGDDTTAVAAQMAPEGLRIVVVPKTIDLDIAGTDYSLGFHTALQNCVEAIERSRAPARSHHWVQVVEVMGREAGHIALWSAVATGASFTLIPEVPFVLDRLLHLIDERMAAGRKDRRLPAYAIAVVAEGAAPAGLETVTSDATKDAFGHPRLGGIGSQLSKEIRAHTPHDSRHVALGHTQRGGDPTAIDRIMGHLFGVAAVEALLEGKKGVMVAARGVAPACRIETIPLGEVGGRTRLVDVADHYDRDLYNAKQAALPLALEAKRV